VLRRGECPSNSLFLKNNEAEAPKGPRPIVFKEWRDTRTFSNLKSIHCTLLRGSLTSFCVVYVNITWKHTRLYFKCKLKSTYDVNLLSELSIIFKEWRVMNNVDRGGVIVLFNTLDNIHRLSFVTRLIINTLIKYSGWILSWRMSSFSFRAVSFRFYFVSHFTDTQQKYQVLRIGECPSNSLFLKNNEAEAPKGPRPIVFKEWRDTRTFSNLKSTHCTLLMY
jgi:hypothetical protein